MFYNLKKKELGKSIYRTMPLERLLDIFLTRQNTLINPEKWEDTFENFILKSKVKLLSGEVIEYNIHDRIYGQCWTFQNASDAMWRIYSPDKNGIRVRTTVRCLLESIYDTHPNLPEAKCCLGKVEYLTEKRLMDFANSIFDDSGISVENIFKSLLVKRNAFKHESEVRLLYDSWEESESLWKIYKYNVNPHKLIKEIVVDPRKTDSEFEKVKTIIEKVTGYKDPIKKSSLYKLPEDRILNVPNVLA